MEALPRLSLLSSCCVCSFSNGLPACHFAAVEDCVCILVPLPRMLALTSGLDVHGTGRRPVHRFDRAWGKARPGIVSWKCTCLCGDPLCHGDLHWTSLPLVCQNLCQLDSSLRACPCPGLHCRRSRAGWSHLATVILLDDQSLRMAHVV